MTKMLGTHGQKESERNSYQVFIDSWQLLQKQVIKAKEELLFIFQMKTYQTLSKQLRIKTSYKDSKELSFTGQDKSKMSSKIKIHSKTTMKAILL